MWRLIGCFGALRVVFSTCDSLYRCACAVALQCMHTCLLSGRLATSLYIRQPCRLGTVPHQIKPCTPVAHKVGVLIVYVRCIVYAFVCCANRINNVTVRPFCWRGCALPWPRAASAPALLLRKGLLPFICCEPCVKQVCSLHSGRVQGVPAAVPALRAEDWDAAACLLIAIAALHTHTLRIAHACWGPQAPHGWVPMANRWDDWQRAVQQACSTQGVSQVARTRGRASSSQLCTPPTRAAHSPPRPACAQEQQLALKAHALLKPRKHPSQFTQGSRAVVRALAGAWEGRACPRGEAHGCSQRASCAAAADAHARAPPCRYKALQGSASL